MATRYAHLRNAIAALAAPPEIQVDYLDRLLASLTEGGSAEGYGNVELIEGFEDVFIARDHMLEQGEINQAEMDAICQLNALIDAICAEQDDDLWQRSALFADERWQRIRVCASEVMGQLPEAERQSDFTRSSGANWHTIFIPGPKPQDRR